MRLRCRLECRDRCLDRERRTRRDDRRLDRRREVRDCDRLPMFYFTQMHKKIFQRASSYVTVLCGIPFDNRTTSHELRYLGSSFMTHSRGDARDVRGLADPLFALFVSPRLGSIGASYLIGSEVFPCVPRKVTRASPTRSPIVRAPSLTRPSREAIVVGLSRGRIPASSLLVTARRPLHLPRAVFTHFRTRTRVAFAAFPQFGTLFHGDAGSHSFLPYTHGRKKLFGYK